MYNKKKQAQILAWLISDVGYHISNKRQSKVDVADRQIQIRAIDSILD